MPRKSLNRLVILMVCVLVFLAVNLFITTRLFLNAKKSSLMLRSREPLPCKAVPTRFVMEEPECANKLLRSMNVTNVRILPAATSNTAWDDETLARYLRKAMSHKLFEEIRAFEPVEGEKVTGDHQSYSGKNQT